MDALDWVTIVIALISGGSMGAIIAAYISIRKLPHDVRNLDATGDKTREEASEASSRRAGIAEDRAERAGTRLEVQTDKVVELREELSKLRIAQSKLEISIAEMTAEIASQISRLTQLEASDISKDAIIAELKVQVTKLQSENYELLQLVKKLTARIEELGGGKASNGAARLAEAQK